jgi:colicin import membrane protein
MMQWLLKYEGYPAGVVVAILLHAVLIYIVMPKKFSPENLVRIEQPSYVSATVAKENPQRVRQLQELERQRQQEEAKTRREREAAKAAEEKQKQELAKQEAAKKLEVQKKKEAETQAQKQREQTAVTEKERQAKEAEQKKQEVAKREAAEREQIAQEKAAREAAEREAANQAAAQSQALSAEAQLIAQYEGIIRDIIESNWIQPPSARNGMQVLINIRLSPVGDILSSTIVQSSGDAVFDRSALQAVDKSESFPELKDLPPGVFERNFRDFNLLFSPEGLLR